MSDVKNGEAQSNEPGRKRRLTGRLPLSAKARNWAMVLSLVLPGVSGLVLGVIATFKGEPVAEQTWETLKAKTNEQSRTINEINLKLAHQEGFVEGQQLEKLQTKLDQLQKDNEKLKTELESKNEPKPVVALPPPPPPKPVEECKVGRVRGDDGKCRYVPKPVAARVKADREQAKDTRRELVEEKRRRMKEEKRRKKVEQKVQEVKRRSKKIKMLNALPDNLEEAAAYQKDDQ